MPESINTVQILYIAFRLAPFIIVSYFALNSLMNFTIRGIIYLIGLLIVSFMTVMISGLIPTGQPSQADEDSTCNIITLTGNITQPLSNLPLSITVYSYTLFNILTYVLLHVNVQAGESMNATNIPTIIFFCLLIFIEFLSSAVMNKCYSPINGAIALVLGGLGGSFWAYFIYNSGTPDMTFYSTASDICTRPSKLKYQCTKSN